MSLQMKTVGFLRGLYTEKESAMSQQITVHLIQCLCPARHCIMATGFEEPPGDIATATEFLRHAVESSVEAKAINPWCGLCRAPLSAWSYEVKSIHGKTLEEVLPALLACQSEQQRVATDHQAQEKASRN